MTLRPPYLSLALLSATALSYEVLLMRLFSIIQWHHFAYLVIALALLGYGFSGTLLWLFGERAIRRYPQAYVIALGLFAVSATVAFLLSQSIDFNIEELLWSPRQAARLLLLFLLLTLPFVFAAGAICMTFMAFPQERVARIYAFDLLGAGAGSLAIIGLMYLLMPEQILVALSLTALGAAWLATWELNPSAKRMIRATLGAAALALAVAAPHLSLTYSPYKGLAQTLQIKGTEVLQTRSSPLGYLTLVASREVPLRHAPGLSLVADTLPPDQLGLFTDADNLSAVTAYPESVRALAYLDQTTAALPYHLRKPGKLLVVGSGTGSDLLLARYHGATSIDALELNPQVIELVNELTDYAGPVYRHPGTRVHIAEARDFLSHSKARFDLIQIALIDAAGASASGLYALNESYLYTREAMSLYLSRLTPGGYLAITRWIKIPPRDTLKLFATALQALRMMGVSEPEQSLVKHSGAEGLVVLRSLGKFFGLAGIRLGFVFAWPSLLRQMAEVLGPWHVSGPAREVARLALGDRHWQRSTRIQLIKNGQRLADLLSEMGLSPSGGTALFQYVQTADAKQLHRSLAEQGIFSRLFSEPAALRFGLPANEDEWQRLHQALHYSSGLKQKRAV